MEFRQVNKTTFRQDIKTNPKDDVSVVIGDDKQPDFKPQVKVERWANEVNCSLRLVEDANEAKEKPTIIQEAGKIKYLKSKREVHIYDLGVSAEHPENATEFEVVLKEKPATNVVQFTVQDKDVDYFYQPALTPKEIAQGSQRPENVVGSYAVYAKTPKTNWTGGKEYKTGKIGHIYRPKIIDSAGTEVWGDLHIENGILSVTIPQDFLDKAVYPVRHAAGLTFGYNHISTSFTFVGKNYLLAVQGTPVDGDGTVDKISVYAYCATFPSTGKLKSGLFLVSDGTIVANGIGPEKVINDYPNKQWWDIVYSTSPNVANGTAYYVGVIQNDSSSYVGYDNAGTIGGYKANNYATPANFSPPLSGTNYKWDIYATYTAGGGGTDVNDTRDAEIRGKDSANSAREAEVSGKDSSNSVRSAEVTGKDAANSARDAETSGKAAASADRNSELTGKDSATDSRLAEISGKEASDDSRPAEIEGKDSSADSRPAEISGIDSVVSSRDTEIIGKDSADTSRAAEVAGVSGIQESRASEVSGIDEADDTRDAEISGKESGYSDRLLEVSGMDSAYSSRGMETIGQDSSQDGRSATIWGKDTISDIRSSEVIGSLFADDLREAEISGRAGLSEIRAAEVSGKADITDSRGAETSGKVGSDSLRNAEISGTDTEESGRAAEVRGSDTDTSSRPAEIVGGIAVSSSRGASVIGIRRNPYTKSSEKYSESDSPYSKVPLPYSDS